MVVGLIWIPESTMSYEGMVGGDGCEMRSICTESYDRETDTLLCVVVGRFVFAGYHYGYRYPVEMEDMKRSHLVDSRLIFDW